MVQENKKIYTPSPKAQEVYRMMYDVPQILLEGAIRSSKTFTMNIAFLKRLERLPPCNVLVSGATMSSVTRNVVADWKNLIGDKKFINHTAGKDDYMEINHGLLKGKKFYVRGACKESDEKNIRGATFGAWYADELTLHAKSFYDMGTSRLSMPYSFFMATTNPDTPTHYVKKTILDNDDLKKISKYTGFPLIYTWKFYLDDNSSLTEQIKEQYRARYKGVFYNRFILGEWCIADGIVYEMFDVNDHVVDYPQKIDYRVIGVDYGTHNPTVFLDIGIRKNPRTYSIEREFFYDGVYEMKQKSPSELVTDFIDFIGNRNYKRVFVDPSALGFIIELKNRTSGLDIVDEETIIRAKNTVVGGIQVIQDMLYKKELKVHRSCTHTIGEFHSYSWSKTNALTGRDDVEKVNDHCMDALRYPAFTLFGNESYISTYQRMFR